MQNEPAAPHPLRGTPSLLRAINDRTALELLLEHGPMSRADIGALTGLSKPTTSHLRLRLKQAGLVVLEGRRAARGAAAMPRCGPGGPSRARPRPPGWRSATYDTWYSAHLARSTRRPVSSCTRH